MAASARELQRFVRSVYLVRDQVTDFSIYPFAIPAIQSLEELELDASVTFFVGDNGSGKSTLLEAIAVAAGFNAEGGSRHIRFQTRPTESELHRCIRLVRGARRPRDGYFLRAESFFNVVTETENLGGSVADGNHGRSFHEQSHGEAFLQLVTNRFGADGLYIMDEPEAALSPQRQLSMLAVMRQLIASGAQLIIATHSPILLAYPDALIYQLGPAGMDRVDYQDTEHYQITRDFLNGRELYFRHLFDAKPSPTDEENSTNGAPQAKRSATKNRPRRR
ncbi:MAG: AAA family ATPase [Kofleriaceae bacterium]